MIKFALVKQVVKHSIIYKLKHIGFFTMLNDLSFIQYFNYG